MRILYIVKRTYSDSIFVTKRVSWISTNFDFNFLYKQYTDIFGGQLEGEIEGKQSFRNLQFKFFYN